MKLNQHVAETLDSNDKLQSANEIRVGSDYSSVSVTRGEDDRWQIISNGQPIASDSSLQDALTMACCFYVGRCDSYDSAPNLIPVRNVRDVLQDLDAVLARNDTVAAQLWDVLSALRGPDNDDSEWKGWTTCAIRRAAFPETAMHGFSSASFGWPSTRYSTANVSEHHDKLAHFFGHAKRAAKVLEDLGMLTPDKSEDDDI